MTTPTTRRAAKRMTLNIRIKPEARRLIDRAARVTRKNRTDFVIEASQRAAEDALMDQTVFVAGPEAYAAFVKRLDAPPNPNKRLIKTMRTKAPWDKKK